MKALELRFWFLVLLVFVLTQPGAIAFANWDAPYGFYKDLSVWMGCAGAGLIPVLAYGLYMWRKGNLGLANLVGAVPLTTATIWLSYWGEKAIGGEMGYGTGNVLMFLAGGFIGLVLSLLLLPVSLPYALTGELYYPYDRPLVIAWVVMIALALLLGAAYLKERRREKLTESEGRDPSVSSSELKGP